MRRHGLVERGVEHADLRQFGEQIDGRVDAAQVGRVVQWRQLDVGFDAGQGFVGEQGGREELLATVHHAVADAVQMTAGGVFDARQDLRERGLVVGIRYLVRFPCRRRSRKWMTASAVPMHSARPCSGKVACASLTRANLIDELPQLITKMLRAGIGAP